MSQTTASSTAATATAVTGTAGGVETATQNENVVPSPNPQAQVPLFTATEEGSGSDNGEEPGIGGGAAAGRTTAGAGGGDTTAHRRERNRNATAEATRAQEQQMEQFAETAAKAGTNVSNMRDARKRLMHEFQKLQKDVPEGIVANPIKGDLFHWSAIICGPQETIWEGGVFRLQLNFTPEYPMSPPDIKFLTRVFHPNVYVNGHICMDVLKSRWSPVYDISTLLLSIMSLLADPNPQSAANGEAARMYQETRYLYEKEVEKVVNDSLEQSYSDDDDDDDDA